MYAFTHFSLSFVIHPLSVSSTQAGVNDHEQPQQPMVTWEHNISCCWVHLSYLVLLFSYPSSCKHSFSSSICTCLCVSQYSCEDLCQTVALCHERRGLFEDIDHSNRCWLAVSCLFRLRWSCWWDLCWLLDLIPSLLLLLASWIPSFMFCCKK